MQITENRLLLERVKNETGMYRTISENYDKQKKREHEYKNQLALIAALASENRVDEISHYLKQISYMRAGIITILSLKEMTRME